MSLCTPSPPQVRQALSGLLNMKKSGWMSPYTRWCVVLVLRLVEPLGLRLRDALAEMDLHQPIADEQRGRDACLDRLLVASAHDQAVDDRVHVLHPRLIELHLLGDVDRLAVDDRADGIPSCEFP